MVFGVAVEKECLPKDEHPYGIAFEEIVNRFDLFLGRHNRTNQDDLQRGLLVVAESSYRIYLEILAHKIRGQGTRWGETRNLADIPFFTPARNTRLLQLADFCANAIFGRYEWGYTRYFDKICGQVDQEGGRLHGLVHLCREPYKCYCPACTSRRPSEPLERPLL